MEYGTLHITDCLASAARATVLLAKPLFGPLKRRKQPERYAKCNPKFLGNIISLKRSYIW
ncbi:hypothetical protein PilKf_01283 [Pillotina sp. SPG140]|jgi:hypothetical protein